MAWKRNKRLVSQGFRDLQYLPKERSGWDGTLTALAYGMRMAIERRSPDLNAWAARHGIAGSGRYQDLGANAWVLWHGTSRQRADKIVAHGLFHKKGLWTAVDPLISHQYCRSRSEQFASEGAVVCLLLDRRDFVQGRDYDEGTNTIVRFHGGLPPDVVEYVLVHEAIHFSGDRRARQPAPWPQAKFKKRSGLWVPQQKTPVRYCDSVSYSSVEEFAGICLDRLLEELVEVTALEIFSVLYRLVRPRDALEHEQIFDIIEEKCVPCRHRGKWRTFRARTFSHASAHVP